MQWFVGGLQLCGLRVLTKGRYNRVRHLCVKLSSFERKMTTLLRANVICDNVEEALVVDGKSYDHIGKKLHERFELGWVGLRNLENEGPCSCSVYYGLRIQRRMKFEGYITRVASFVACRHGELCGAQVIRGKYCSPINKARALNIT